MKNVKCLVWDLDNTLWQGTLAEGDPVDIAPDIRDLVDRCDQRGILQSIASRNDFEPAWEALGKLQMQHYFLHPQINWGDKSESINRIAEKLQLSLDTFVFVDDQPFERDEVAFHIPGVRVLDVSVLPAALTQPDFSPRFLTDESRNRRRMYQSDLAQQTDLDSFDGTRNDFLRSLNMTVTIRQAAQHDLQRAEELTLRTSQLNTTGRTFSYDQLCAMIESPAHQVLVVGLEDRYGSSGIVGLVVLDRTEKGWLIELLIMSCRVMNRGIGGIVLKRLLRSVKAQGLEIQADYVPTDRNRQIYLTYRLHGFEEVNGHSSPQSAAIRLVHHHSDIPAIPDHVRIVAPDLPV